MRSGWTTEIVASADALGGVEEEWWALWRRCPGATPFSAPAWALPWWSAFEPGALRATLVRREGRLVALAPVYLEDGPLGRRLLPIGLGLSDYLDVLLDPDAAERAAECLTGALAEAGGWDSWELEELAPEAAAWALPVPAGCAVETTDQSACPVLRLHQDGLLAVPSGQRRKIRMARHRVARRNGVTEIAGPGGMASFLDIVAGLHGARWAARGEGGVLADARVRRFHRAALPRLAAAGMVRATTLAIEGRTIGAYYGLRAPGAAYAYLGGFHPDFAFESPGTGLLADAIEAAAGEGATEFHFLRGREPYKYAWGAVDRWNRRRSFRRTGP